MASKLTSLAFIALIFALGYMHDADASCCCCGGCCPCCCCKPIVIKLPPPPTKICPCCCCCKPCCCCCCKPCCCCCCKPCCCCCCPCCCGGGGGYGRKKRDVIDVAAKKISDIFLPQRDAVSYAPHGSVCGGACGAQSAQTQPFEFNFGAQQPFHQQAQQAPTSCGNVGTACGGCNGAPNIGPMPLNEYAPMIRGAVNLNNFHASGVGGFGSNLGAEMGGMNFVDSCGSGACADCPGGGCMDGGYSGAMGHLSNVPGMGGMDGCHGNGMYGGARGGCMRGSGGGDQFGGGMNGCARRRRRRRATAAFTQLRKACAKSRAARKSASAVDQTQRSNGKTSSSLNTLAGMKKLHEVVKQNVQKAALAKKTVRRQHRRRHNKLKGTALAQKRRRKERAHFGGAARKNTILD